ncbi:MAG TPA: hypothetical protein VND19_15550 [Acetobacteraceae bacterium]|nr:hypothetical protein [Acetobacteraceae bacterium]
MSLIDNSEYWRARAHEARITADCMFDAGCRNIMLDIARDYERIMQWFEARPAFPADNPGC